MISNFYQDILSLLQIQRTMQIDSFNQMIYLLLYINEIFIVNRLFTIIRNTY